MAGKLLSLPDNADMACDDEAVSEALAGELVAPVCVEFDGALTVLAVAAAAVALGDDDDENQLRKYGSRLVVDGPDPVLVGVSTLSSGEAVGALPDTCG